MVSNNIYGGRRSLRITLGTLAVVLLLAVSAGATNINSCQDISSAGEYVLNASILNSGAPICINITSSDVVFDGAGFTIDGLMNGLSVAGVEVSNISTALTNVTVKNLTVTDWYYGIYYNNTAKGNITGNNASNNIIGIDLEFSSDNTLIGNNASNNDIGIHLSFSRNNTLIGNNASNPGTGILLGDSSDNNTLNSNNALNGGIGIYLLASNNDTLSSNNASNNFDYGIILTSSSNNTLIGNNASNNKYYGIALFSSLNNKMTNNTAKNNAPWDFYSQFDSLNNMVANLEIGSTVISFESKDIALRNSIAPVLDPANFHNISKYINATNNSADSWLFLNVSYNESDLDSVNESTLRIAKNNGSWITDPSVFANNFGVNTAQNYVFANITSFGSIFAPLGVISAPPKPKFNITGFKINDTNGNGKWDEGESGIQGWDITLKNATTGAVISSNLTDTNGFYQFTNIANGSYNVTEEMKGGFTPTNTTFKLITLVGIDIINLNFTNQPVMQPVGGVISGYKINDTNGNGKWDAGEKGISNWTIGLIRIIGTGKDTRVIRKETFTDVMGFYEFGNLPAGRYIVIEKFKREFVPTSSPVKRIKLAQDENSMNNNFTNRPVNRLPNIGDHEDMGDNIDSSINDYVEVDHQEATNPS